MRFSRVFLAKLEKRGSICRKGSRVQKRRSDDVQGTGKNVGTHQGPSRFADVGGDRMRGRVGRHVVVVLSVRGSSRWITRLGVQVVVVEYRWW